MILEKKRSSLPDSGWVKFSLKRQLVTSSVIFWILAVSVVSLAFLGFGQSYMLQETSQRNTQIASIIGRDLNAQVAEILADARNFGRIWNCLIRMFLDRSVPRYRFGFRRLKDTEVFIFMIPGERCVSISTIVLIICSG